MLKKTVFLLLLIFIISSSYAQRLQAFQDKITSLERRLKKIENAEIPDEDSTKIELQKNIDILFLEIEKLKAKSQVNSQASSTDSIAQIVEGLRNDISSIKFKSQTVKKQETLSTIKPRVNIRGSFDIDLVADQRGQYYANDYSNIYMDFEFNESVDFTFVFGLSNGTIPGGKGSPEELWILPAYKGAWLNWNNAFDDCDLKLGDISYKFGEFDYYAFKNSSMISIGTKYLRGGNIKKHFEWGVFNAWSGILHDDNIFQTAFSLGLPITENHKLSAYTVFDFDQKANSRPFRSGLKYNGNLANDIQIKAILGYLGIAEADSSETDKNKAAFNLLFEPVFSISEKFWVNSTLYYQSDETGILDCNERKPLFGDFFFYIEPVFHINNSFDFGLPLEYHEPDNGKLDDEEFWFVPTAYVYPSAHTQIWIWAMANKPIYEVGSNAIFSLGIELIAEFE